MPCYCGNPTTGCNICAPYKINYHQLKIEPSVYMLQEQVNMLLNQILHLKQELYTKDKLISSLEERLEQQLKEKTPENNFTNLGEKMEEFLSGLDKVFSARNNKK